MEKRGENDVLIFPAVTIRVLSRLYFCWDLWQLIFNLHQVQSNDIRRKRGVSSSASITCGKSYPLGMAKERSIVVKGDRGERLCF